VPLGEPQLPRAARGLIELSGRGAVAAIVAGNLDHIGIGLGHTGGNWCRYDLGTSFTTTLAAGLTL